MIELPKTCKDAGFVLVAQPPYPKAEFGKHGFIDFSELTPERCERLVARKFAYIAKAAPKQAEDVKVLEEKAKK